MEEKREKVFDGRIFAQQRSETTDLVRQRSANVLGCILAQISDARDNTPQDNFLFEEL